MNKLANQTQMINKKDTVIEISILTCPYDTNFLKFTVPHLAKSLANVNALRTLLVDWLPASGYFSTVYPERQEERFEEICLELLNAGWIDRIVRIPYEKKFVSNFLNKAVKGKFNVTHDMRGYPLYGSMFGVLGSEKRFVVHFDADILIHQGSAENWISRGISLLEKYSDIAAVMPRSGPPTLDGSIFQGGEKYSLDTRGFHSFTSFSNRLFLVEVEKFWSIHPIKPLWLGRRDKLRSFWDGKGKALSWESLLTKSFQENKLLRADLISNDSWSLHPPIKDQTFLEYLPAIIAAVEAGHYPPEQSGHYDLDINLWISFLQEFAS